LGQEAGSQATGDANVYIGAGMHGVAGESNACYISSIFSQTSASGVQVFINSDNKLGTVTSSKRFKEHIKPMDKASEAILALQPVTFRYKKDFDPSGTAQFGLVAEEVEKVNPDLVVHDKEGKPYSVRYDQVNAMLLNEFLKEHREVEEQDCKIQQQEATIAQQRKDFEATITELKKEVGTVVAHLKEQDSKLQRVSDQVEASNPAAQMLLNDH
jgi:septal ring factor EnvC (AmiA/AmiB activator)